MKIIVFGKGPRDSVGASNTEIPASVAQCMCVYTITTNANLFFKFPI